MSAHWKVILFTIADCYAINFRTKLRIWFALDGHVLSMRAVVLAPATVLTLVQHCLISETSHLVQPYLSAAGTELTHRHHYAVFSVHSKSVAVP